jgi:hypothetical protein
MGRGVAGWQSGAYPLDALGLHLYIDQNRTTSRGNLQAYLQDVRAVYLAFEGGGTGKRIEVTEAGWTNVFVDANVQAANVQTLYATLRSTSYVDRGYWFNVQDIPEAGLYYGLTDTDRRPKPAQPAYQQATGGPPPAPTATATPIPTATPTPIPLPSCNPRPPVGVQAAPAGPGRLAVTISASGVNNWLTALHFTSTANGLVDVAGQTGRAGAFTITLPAGTASTQLAVRRAGAGPVTVQVTVSDRCGDWPTLVGGGPFAF